MEHNQISRSEVDKSEIFDILNLHLDDPDQEIQHTALQLIQVSIYFVHTMCGLCAKAKELFVLFNIQLLLFRWKSN